MVTQDDPQEPEESSRDEQEGRFEDLSAEDRRERRHRHREARRALREERNRQREERRSRRHGQHRRRKERVLHTRVSEELSDDIRRLAEDLRVPASNLVRNVLEEVFSVVEEVSGDVGELLEEVVEEAEDARERVARRLASRRERHRRRRHRGHRSPRGSGDEDIERELRRDEAEEAAAQPPAGSATSFEDVVGWQPLVLNRERSCARCGTGIPRGERAFVGLTEAGLSRTTLCQECTKAL